MTQLKQKIFKPARRDDDGHEVATGVGASIGAVTGAMVGTAVGGPMGAAVGAAVGAAAGSIAGEGAGEVVNPRLDDDLQNHGVATGVGVGAGAASGAVIGMAAGPVGLVVGGKAGETVARAANPAAEDAYWTSTYEREPCYLPGRSYLDYQPAYALGYGGARRFANDAGSDDDFAREWERVKGPSWLTWQEAKPASRAACQPVERSVDRTY